MKQIVNQLLNVYDYTQADGAESLNFTIELLEELQTEETDIHHKTHISASLITLRKLRKDV